MCRPTQTVRIEMFRFVFLLVFLISKCQRCETLESVGAGVECPHTHTQNGPLYSTARDCVSPLSESFLPTPPTSSESNSLDGCIWDVPVPSVLEKIYGPRHGIDTRQHHDHFGVQNYQHNLTPLPAFVFITATSSASDDNSYQATWFAHVHSKSIDNSSASQPNPSASAPDPDTLRLGSQILSLYIVVNEGSNFEDQDQTVQSMSVCMRRMRHYCLEDANFSASSLPFRPPSSFTCLPLLEQTLVEITNKFREKRDCDSLISQQLLPPFAPIQLCRMFVKYEVLLPAHVLPPLVGSTFEFFTYADVVLQLSDSRMLITTPSPPLFFNLVPLSSRFKDLSSVLPMLSEASSLPSSPSPTTSQSPHIHVPVRDALNSYFIDTVYVDWPHEGCSGKDLLVEALDGHRVCSYSDNSNRPRARWMIFRSSGDVWSGLGLRSVVAAEDGSVGGDMIVFDCTATVTQRAMGGLGQWQWKFYPWCLPSFSSHPAVRELVFSPTPSFNSDYAHLDAIIPIHEVLESPGAALVLQRMRGTLSLAMAQVLLNDNSTSSITIMLDCGCCGWTTLLEMAAELIHSSSSNTLQARSVVARLPLMSTSSQYPAVENRWICHNISDFSRHTKQDRDNIHQGKGLRQVMSRIRKAFRVVSWDRLSYEELHVTLMPRAVQVLGKFVSADRNVRASASEINDPSVSTHPSHPLPCAIGDIDVCDAPGCNNSDSADECLSPKIIDYVKTVMKMCILRRQSFELFHTFERVGISASALSLCVGLHKMNTSFVLRIKDDPALVAVIDYATKHAKFNANDSESKSRGAFFVKLDAGGIGNVFQNLLGPALMAIIDNRQLFVSLSSSMSRRFSGYFTCAVDAIVEDSVKFLGSLLGTEWHIRTVLNWMNQRDYMRCVWGVNETSHHGSITQWNNGDPPFTLLMNEKFSHAINSAFGVESDFYLSHFLIVPIAEFRQRAAHAMAAIRAKYQVVIGVHMRWVAEGRQYLLPEDMDWFLFSAQKLASLSSRMSVAFYVASDSIRHVGIFAKGITMAAAMSCSEGVCRDWAVFTAENLNNSTDSSTADSMIDLIMLSMSDHLIGTEFSTFTTLAASLGAHRPVIVGARAAQKFGRHKMIRVSHSSPIRTDFGASFPHETCFHDILACESHVVDRTFFTPMFISKIGFMNASLYWGKVDGQQNSSKCRPELWDKETKMARQWYENLYDVF
jgi:hypothetical protein